MPKHKHRYQAWLVPQFAPPGSAKVSGYFITAVASTVLWKYWPILQLQENEAQGAENLAYAVSVVSSPDPVYTAAMGIRPSTVLWEQGRDLLFLHALLWRLQWYPGRRDRGTHHPADRKVQMQPQAASNCLGLRSATSALLHGAVLSFSSLICVAWGEERMSPINPW